MRTGWIATSSSASHLVTAFDPGEWAIQLFTHDQLAQEGQSQRDPDVFIFDLEAGTLPDTFRQICEVAMSPVLAVMPNWQLAWAAIEAGADDAMIQSVDPAEVLFRVHRLMRAKQIVHVDELVIDLAARRARFDRRLLDLSPAEFRLLACLARQIGQTVSYEALLQDVWGCDPDTGGTLNQVKCCVKRLRAKIEPDPRRPLFILTVKGRGYRLRAQTQWEEYLPSNR
jgi:DNA-binding response OmpR family regulator